MAAKIVLNRKKYYSATRCLEELQWSPIKQRIDFKLATLVHRCIHGSVPSKLENIRKKKPRREGM